MIDLSHIPGRRFAVMGLGKSGLATARALLAGGKEVLAWDDGEASRAAARAAGIPVADLHSADLSGVEALVLSPGIPHTFPQPNPVAARAKAAGIPILGDVELLWRAVPKAAYLGITGTNGKSTTTSLVAHILAGAGRRIQVGGNLGTPALTFDMLGEDGIYVLEMSSYQLELTPSLAFNIAVLLNVTPDHLGRHGGMDGYVAAKRLIFRHPRRSHTAVVAVDDAHTAAIFDALERAGDIAVVPVSAEKAVPGVFVRDGLLFDGGAEPAVDLNAIPTLPGRHNWQNAAAAFAACRAAGLGTQEIRRGMESFPGLAHRQQLVGRTGGPGGGIAFVNDSKATNAEAAAMALVCYDPIYWVLGGQPKESGLSGLEPHLHRIRHAFLIGEAAGAFAAWLAERGVAHTLCGDLARAVPAAAAMARAEALPGATVLLSPACASWDQFASFERRGDAFVELAREEIARDRAGPPASGGGAA